MDFSFLSQGFQKIVRSLTGQSKLSEANTKAILQEIRTSLLEADVSLSVVESLSKSLSKSLVGIKVEGEFTVDQMVVKTVNDELMKLLGTGDVPWNIDQKPFVVHLFLGLQGSGKTTTLAKVANYLVKEKGKRPLLVGADVHRPGAREQLKVLADQLQLPFFTLDENDAVAIAEQSLLQARRERADVILIDTAGRLQIDDVLMNELEAIYKAVRVHHSYLVIDAMIGQKSAQIVQTFHQRFTLSSAILTKIDSETRSGVAVSLRHDTGVPIQFLGTGEKIEDLEVFHADRLAGRILGMGDILTLVEQLQSKLDQEKMEKTTKRMMNGQFDLEDMLIQMQQMNKMGPLGSIMKLLPGMPKISPEEQRQAEVKMRLTKVIISSMTLEERRHPEIMRSSRKERVAKGSGTSLTDVNNLLKNYERMKEQMRVMANMMKGGKMPNLPF